MRYGKIQAARFLRRPNRFVAEVELEGRTEAVHVKNTGRCRELLVPGARVYLTPGENPARKTAWDLIAVEKGPLLINMDAQAPTRVSGEWAAAGHFVPGLTLLRPETTWGRSRFDFYWEAGPERRGFVEVKGVTLEQDGSLSRCPHRARGPPPGGALRRPAGGVRVRRLFCHSDEGPHAVPAQRGHSPRLRGGPPGGGGGRSGCAGLRLPGDPGPAVAGRPGAH